MIPVAREKNLTQTLEKLKVKGFWSVGLDGNAQTAWNEVDWSGPVALVVGSEGKGLRPALRKHCDVLARIPLEAGVESLNLSVATAVALFEAVRQRS